MAATVTGAFVIVDRASSAMKRIESQAKRTDRAIADLGKRLDGVSTNKHAQGLDKTTRAMRNFDRETRIVDTHVKKLGNNTDDLTTRLAKLGGAFKGIGSIFSILKIPAIIAGFGGLVQVVGALSAGVVALLPRLGQMSGALAVGATAYVSLGIAAGTAVLAMKNVTQAVGGSESAMKKLTPQAKAFVRELKAVGPAFKTIQTSAQEGLFPGLTKAINKSKDAIPTLRGITKSVGTGLGNQANRLADNFTDPRSLRQFTQVAGESRKVVAGLTTIFMHLGHALFNVIIAARPLTNWLIGSIAHWSKWADGASKAGLATGKLTDFFMRSKVAIHDATSILMDWWGIIRNVSKASNTLGESIWTSWIKGADSLRKLTESQRGQNSMRSWFNSMKGPLHEVWGLTKALGKAFLWLSKGSEGSSMLRSFRQLVWPLAKIVRSVTAAFGPTLADTITHLASSIETIVLAMGEWGRLVNVVVRAFDWMLRNIPGLTQAIGAMVALFTFRKVASGISTVIGGLGAQLKLTQANTAAQLELNAARMGGISPAIAGRGATPQMTIKQSVNSALGIGGPSMASRAGGMMMGGLRAAGKAFLPLSALFAGVDFLSTPGDIGNKAKGALSGATFGLSGLIPGLGVDTPETAGEARGRGHAQAGHFLESGLVRQHALSRRILAVKHAINQADGMDAVRLKGQLRTLQQQQGAAKRIAEIKAGALVTGGGGFRNAFKFGTAHGLSGVEAAAQVTGGVTNRIANLRGGDFKEQSEATALAERFIKAMGPVLKREGIARGSVRAEVEKALGAKIIGGHAVGAGAGGDSWKDTRRLATSPLFGVQAAAGGGPLIHRIRAQLGTRFSPGRTSSIIDALMAGNQTLAGAVGSTVPRLKSGRGQFGRLSRFGMAPPSPAGPETNPLTSLIGRLPKLGSGLKAKIFSVPDITKESQAASKPIRNFRDNTIKAFEKVNRNSTEQMETASKNVRRSSDTLTERLLTNNKKMVASTEQATAATRQDLIQKLTGLGITGGALQGAITGTSGNTRGGKKNGKKNARGGRILGQGLQDTVEIGGGNLAAPGELIVNRHTEQRVNKVLGAAGTSLEREVSGETRPHSAMQSRFALGGRQRFATGGIVRAGKLAERLGLSVSGGPGYGGIPSSGHVGGSLHYSGLAYDVSGSPDQMRHYFFAALKAYRSSLNELFYDPIGWYIDGGKKVSGAIGGHSDHVHIGFMPGGAVGGARGLGGGMLGMGKPAPRLKQQQGYGGPGTALQAMSQAAGDIFHQAAQGRLNKAAGSRGGGGPAVSGNLKGGLMSWLSQALKITGHFSKSNLMALKGRALQESGGNPRAVNNWDSNASAGHPSQGLLQTIPETFAAYKEPGLRGGILNPVANAAAAINYMYARYGHIVGPSGSGYAKGGRVPWYGKGGDFVAHRPQVIGVGDGGPERVQITPQGRGTAGTGGGVRIGHIHIENHRSGDIQKQIEKEVGAALRNVTAHIQNQTVTDDQELMS